MEICKAKSGDFICLLPKGHRKPLHEAMVFWLDEADQSRSNQE